MNDYARYTMTLDDALHYDPSILDLIIMSTEARTNRLREMFVAMYGDHEIGGETTGQFKGFLARIGNIYRARYEEMLDAYEQAIDWKDGNVTSNTFQDEGLNTYGRTNSSSANSQANTLPNRVVTDPAKYKTSTSSTDTTSQDGGTDKVEHTGTNTAKSGDKVELRSKYLDSIRDLYEDFCKHYAMCFVGLLD